MGPPYFPLDCPKLAQSSGVFTRRLLDLRRCPNMMTPWHLHGKIQASATHTWVCYSEVNGAANHLGAQSATVVIEGTPARRYHPRRSCKPSRVSESSLPLLRGGEGTVHWDTVAPNCSTGNSLSNFNNIISSRSSNWEIRARWGFPTVSPPPSELRCGRTWLWRKRRRRHSCRTYGHAPLWYDIANISYLFESRVSYVFCFVCYLCMLFNSWHR